jgi:hypothetical protein
VTVVRAGELELNQLGANLSCSFQHVDGFANFLQKRPLKAAKF